MLAFACRWTSAALPVHKVTPDALCPSLKDGLLLCDLLALVFPDLEFRGLHLKARTRKTAVENIEQALSQIWRRRGTLPARVICTADEIFEGAPHQRKISRFFQELFEHLVIREIRPHSKAIISFFDPYLSLFGWGFSSPACASPCRRGRGGLAAELGSCVRFGLLLCLADALDLKEFARACYGRPQSPKELAHNAHFVLAKFRHVHLPCLLDESDLAGSGSSELMLLQLHALYESLVSDASLVLPPVDDRDRIALALGLGSCLSDAELAELRFRDGTPLLRVDEDFSDAPVAAPSLRPNGSPTKTQRFIPIFEAHDGKIFDGRRLISTRMTARYLEVSGQCTFQFWPIADSQAAAKERPDEPFLVFDLATMLDVERDDTVRGGLKISLHAAGLLKDDFRLTKVKDDVAEIKIVADDWQFYMLEQLEKLRDNYSSSIH